MTTTRSMLQRILAALALAFVLAVRADDSKTAELRENKPSVNKTFKDSTTEGNEKFVRKMTVKILGGDVLKSVKDVANDPNGSVWKTGDWTKNESTSVTYTGVQKKDPEPNKRYAPYFSGTAGPKDAEGQGSGHGAGEEDPNWDWSVLTEYNITGVRMREEGEAPKTLKIFPVDKYIDLFENIISDGITVNKDDVSELLAELKGHLEDFIADDDVEPAKKEKASAYLIPINALLKEARGKAIKYVELDEKLKGWLDTIEGKLLDLTAKYNQKAEEELKEAAAKLKKKLTKKFNPTLLAMADYEYNKGDRDNGEWKNFSASPAPKKPFVIGGGFDVKLQLDAGGAFVGYASVPLEVNVAGKLRVTLGLLRSRLIPWHASKPQTTATVSATPKVTVNVLKYSGAGAGIYVGVETDKTMWYWVIPDKPHWTTWEITADPRTAKEIK